MIIEPKSLLNNFSHYTHHSLADALLTNNCQEAFVQMNSRLCSSSILAEILSIAHNDHKLLFVTCQLLIKLIGQSTLSQQSLLTIEDSLLDLLLQKGPQMIPMTFRSLLCCLIKATLSNLISNHNSNPIKHYESIQKILLKVLKNDKKFPKFERLALAMALMTQLLNEAALLVSHNFKVMHQVASVCFKSIGKAIISRTNEIFGQLGQIVNNPLAEMTTKEIVQLWEVVLYFPCQSPFEYPQEGIVARMADKQYPLVMKMGCDLKALAYFAKLLFFQLDYNQNSIVNSSYSPSLFVVLTLRIVGRLMTLPGPSRTKVPIKESILFRLFSYGWLGEELSWEVQKLTEQHIKFDQKDDCDNCRQLMELHSAISQLIAHRGTPMLAWQILYCFSWWIHRLDPQISQLCSLEYYRLSQIVFLRATLHTAGTFAAISLQAPQQIIHFVRSKQVDLLAFQMSWLLQLRTFQGPSTLNQIIKALSNFGLGLLFNVFGMHDVAKCLIDNEGNSEPKRFMNSIYQHLIRLAKQHTQLFVDRLVNFEQSSKFDMVSASTSLIAHSVHLNTDLFLNGPAALYQFIYRLCQSQHGKTKFLLSRFRDASFLQLSRTTLPSLTHEAIQNYRIALSLLSSHQFSNSGIWSIERAYQLLLTQIPENQLCFVTLMIQAQNFIRQAADANLYGPVDAAIFCLCRISPQIYQQAAMQYHFFCQVFQHLLCTLARLPLLRSNTNQSLGLIVYDHFLPVLSTLWQSRQQLISEELWLQFSWLNPIASFLPPCSSPSPYAIQYYFRNLFKVHNPMWLLQNTDDFNVERFIAVWEEIILRGETPSFNFEQFIRKHRFSLSVDNSLISLLERVRNYNRAYWNYGNTFQALNTLLKSNQMRPMSL